MICNLKQVGIVKGRDFDTNMVTPGRMFLRKFYLKW